LKTLKNIFGIDLRTLALFRVMLALAILADLASRARDLTAHYTDAGVLPRAELLRLPGGWRPSLHLVSGSAMVEAVLFATAAALALALLAGYRTRIATVLSWLLLFSLQSRNDLISQGGDALLFVLLFWSMFLPLGARFSVDAALDRRVGDEPDAYCSLATMGLLVQCMSVYFFSALLKSGTAWIPEGSAVYYALHLDYLATPFAVWFRQFPAIMTGLTYYVWYLELIGPLLMFSPVVRVPLRLVLLAMLITMHVGFFLCLEIGLFPFISITSLLAFTPGAVWDWLEARSRARDRRGVVIYYDGPCEFCRKVCLILVTFLLPRATPVKPAQEAPAVYQEMERHNSWVVIDHDGSRHVRWHALALVSRRSPIFWPLGVLAGAGFLQKLGDRIYESVARNRGRLGELSAVLLPYRTRSIHPSRAANLVVGVLIAYVFYINLTTLPAFTYRLPKRLDGLQATLRLGQTWNMFAPEPTRNDGWFVVPGVLRDGTSVDVLHLRIGDPDWTRPAYLAEEYPTYRWRKYLVRLAHSDYVQHRPFYAQYLCRLWNERTTRGRELVELKLYFNLERVQPDYQPRKKERLLLHVHQCSVPAGPKPESPVPRDPDQM